MTAIGEDQPRPVRAGEELDTSKLAAYLEQELGVTEAITVEQFPGGHSNLTYLVRAGDRELVLRRPPFGSKVKSAHDMGREHTVLSKLAPVYARAPRVFAYEATGDVLGAPFYLMERRRGVILRKDLPPALAADHAQIRRVCELLVDALVELHAVDYTAAGLGDFGKPAGYIERQVTGWTERYAKSQTDDLPAVTEVAAWLAAHMPADGAPALIHNDFKFDNVIFDPALAHITGVLDWEMTTIGDPLMDLGTALSYWAQASDPPAYHALPFGPTARPGMMTRQEVADRYLERSGRRADSLVFYYAFGLLKTAVIAQQIYYRYAKGLTGDARFAQMIFGVRLLSEQARTAIERNAI
ncbi:MAG: phosphotransferase family protein [Deltaproteobacteria bacterium]|nr:phosphotransferase family protein [Deltaproteobacteria bacterium]MDQ3299421.1 phosphotransferase family protein [Myxococcota bacterium]